MTANAGDQFNIDSLFVAAGLANNGDATQTVALQSFSPARSGSNCAGSDGSSGCAMIPVVTLEQVGETRSTPSTVGAFDMTSIFYNGFE